MTRRNTSNLFDAKRRNRRLRKRWFRELLSAVFSLEELPSRYALIPEVAEFPFELRHLIFHSHRIVYQIDEATKSVIILRIYHGSRRALQEKDLKIRRR